MMFVPDLAGSMYIAWFGSCYSIASNYHFSTHAVC